MRGGEVSGKGRGQELAVPSRGGEEGGERGGSTGGVGWVGFQNRAEGWQGRMRPPLGAGQEAGH